MNNSKLSSLTLIPLFAITIAAGAWITIPAAIPFTMQTFCIFLSLYILGGRNGTRAILLYLLLGAIGLPVFSGFSAGLSVLAGPTGGYLVGFIFIGLSYRIGEVFLERRKASRENSEKHGKSEKCENFDRRRDSESSPSSEKQEDSEKHKKPERASKFLFSLLGLVICYVFGTGWFVYISNSSASAVTVLQALSLCVLPYIIPDLLKLLLASKLSDKLVQRLNNLI